ncbi:MAG: zinc ribbon domain-containing protein [Anaerolineaceae bacterium]|nr:zinc ribbon domain-containing protein [Anaerolineaceae bacterium]
MNFIKNKKYIIVLTTLIIALFCNTAISKAQTSVEIQELLVEIWPEFDRPEVLIIYRLSLSEDTSLPADMSLRIPKSSGGPFTLAIQDSDGALFNLEHETIEDGDWIQVKFTTPSLILHLEYYDSDCDLTTSNRNYVFTWPGDYNVRNMAFHIQQPPTASKMVINPTLEEPAIESDGLIYHSGSLGSFEAGITLPLTISYTKPDNTLTFSPQVVQPSEPINTETQGRITTRQLIPWILGAVGISLIAAGAFWYFRGSNFQVSAQKNNRQRHKKPQSTKEPTTADSLGVYCHHCGRRGQQNDIFCRACGTKLRAECND